jgi:predicted SnoaL-like aldol condensation-catalyzing enzyme
MNSISKLLSILVIGTTLSFQSIAEPSVASEISQAEKIVVEFYDKIFVQPGGDTRIRKLAEQYVHENYIQHNPYVATGREAFITAFSRVVKNRPASSKTILKRVIASGDYVVLHVHSYDTAKKAPGSAGVDTFRVVDGKIIEHWDVWQDIPEKMPHDNGMI